MQHHFEKYSEPPKRTFSFVDLTSNTDDIQRRGSVLHLKSRKLFHDFKSFLRLRQAL